MPSVPTLLFASNSAWNLAHFRAPLIDAFVASGARVVCAVPEEDDGAALEAMGARIERVHLSRAGLSPLGDFRTLADYRRVIAAVRPDAMLAFTAKPNIYGSMAAAAEKVPVLNNISGLGTGFLSSGWLRTLMMALYRVALRKSAAVFFQNADDRDLFVERRLVPAARTRLLNGSGVDLAHFSARTVERIDTSAMFLLVARMLRDKGVVEFVEAARRLRAEGADARFVLLGPAGDDNRTAIPRAELEAWAAHGSIEWRGAADDIRPHLAEADVVVLPSYREGFPRTLIEAAAMGKPVIATDVPGCRQAVVPQETGLLCAARDTASLADALRAMVLMGPARRQAMGRANRQRAEAEFGADRIVDAYRAALAACGVTLGR